MKKSIYIALGVILFTVLFGRENRADDVIALRVSDGATISFARMYDEVKNARIVFFGEVHDIREHHQRELEIIRAFHESGAAVAIGLEMFRADSQQALDEWVNGDSSLDQFVPAYYDNWRQPWPWYRDIFLYAREHGIPLVGLNIPGAITEQVARRGFGALSETEKKQLPPGISCDIDPTYRDFIRKAYARHSHGDDRQFQHFCEAQLVRDKAMAWRLIEYLKRQPDKNVIVLAGVGHSWKRGIPAQVARQSPFTRRVILPLLLPDRLGLKTVTTADADYVLYETATPEVVKP
jgi:uncharacterized iron-regulated protein